MTDLVAIKNHLELTAGISIIVGMILYGVTQGVKTLLPNATPRQVKGFVTAAGIIAGFCFQFAVTPANRAPQEVVLFVVYGFLSSLISVIVAAGGHSVVKWFLPAQILSGQSLPLSGQGMPEQEQQVDPAEGGDHV